MGKIQIRIAEEEIIPTVEGSLGGVFMSRDECQSIFDLRISSSAPVWIEWFGVGGVLHSDDTPAMNGQTVTGANSFKVFIPGFASPAISLNTTKLTKTINLYTEEGGVLLDSKDINRFTVGTLCIRDRDQDLIDLLEGDDEFLGGETQH